MSKSPLNSSSSSQAVAKILLEEKAVFIRPQDPFTWTSGVKSPIYCDNRLLISSVQARDIITQRFCERLKKEFSSLDAVAGTATAGIPWAAWIAHSLQLPLLYVRSQPKAHGRGNQIEGRIQARQKVVLIEDLISTGKSSLAAVKALEEADQKVQTLFCIFQYGFSQTQELFKQHSLSVSSLCQLEDLLQYSLDHDQLSSQQVEEVRLWQKTAKLPQV
jgi:orotate phosphoribosyltransferase